MSLGSVWFRPVLSILWVVGWIVLGGSSPLLAAPVVIHDSGHITSLRPYLEPLLGDEEEPVQSPSRPNAGARPLSVEDLLPVRTPEMTPGPLNVTLDPGLVERLRQLPQPFFLIGTDALSRDWLTTHRGTLKNINAVGMLIQANTREEVEAMARLGQGLVITLASGSDLARALNISRYPILISPAGLEQ